MSNIKKLGQIFAGACMVSQVFFAAPLDESYVSEDAKWLAHIDMESLMKGQLSGMAVSGLKEEIRKNNDSAVSVDIDMVLAEIKSITAYGAKLGTDEIDGVILLRAGERLQAIVDGFIAHQELTAEGELPIKRIEDRPFQTYLLEDELYVSFPRKDLVIASKDFDRIENAFGVVQGKSANLSEGKSKLLLNDEEGFFLIATATGLDGLKDMPPQARILQKTKGGQLSIGESDEEFRANLVLSTSGRDVSTQLYRIVQGMLALASFAQVENEGLMDVVNRVEVLQGDDWVSIDFRYPVDRVMDLMSDIMQEHSDNHAEEEKPQPSGDEHSSILHWDRSGKHWSDQHGESWRDCENAACQVGKVERS